MYSEPSNCPAFNSRRSCRAVERSQHCCARFSAQPTLLLFTPTKLDLPLADFVNILGRMVRCDLPPLTPPPPLPPIPTLGISAQLIACTEGSCSMKGAAGVAQLVNMLLHALCLEDFCCSTPGSIVHKHMSSSV